MEGHFSTGQSPQWAVVPMEEEVFSVSSFHGTLEASKTKNGGVAIDGPLQGSMHGPVGHSWNHAFCYRLPVLYKVFHLLFKC